MTQARSALPPSLAPLGLNRAMAAEFIGVSVRKFDEMVDDGRMPRPKEIDGRRVWSRYMLERYFAALPGDSDDEIDTDDASGENWGNLAV